MRSAATVFVILIVLVIATPVRADEAANLVADSDDCIHCHHDVPTCNCVNRDPGHPAKPKHKKPGDRNRGERPPLRYRMCDCDRAGAPLTVGSWAKCSVDEKYSGSYVGGGAALLGRSRTNEEGTWGLDYHGLFEPAKFFLRWTCGRKQGGEGAYATDGEPECHARLHRMVQ